jgi:glycosyltransferase involved in cell wall biosynthesis
MIRGSIDFIDHVQVEGWAQDEAAPETAVSIVVSDNGKVIGRVVAEAFRSDLREAGVGHGRHGFKFVFPAPLSPSRAHVIRLCAADGSDLPDSPQTLAASVPPPATVAGHLDGADRHHVAGWVQYANDPEPVSLIVTANDRLIGRIIANLYRADLEASGIGSGRHGFEWYFPEALSPLEKQVVRVRREIDGLDMPGSPVTIEPATEFDADTQSIVTELLARHDSDDQIEAKIGFLARELDRLIQRKSDLDSHRFIRRRNRDLSRRLGHDEIAAPWLKKSRLRALIIDDRIPALDRDAGSNAIVSHMKSLQRLGYDVSLIASSELQPGTGVAALQASGIDVYTLPFYGSTEELLWRQAGEFDLVYLHRISNAAKYGELVRQHFPKARKIFGVADLHHLRIARQAAVEDRPELHDLAKRLKFAELLAAASADAVITHSDYEADILRKELPKANVHRVLWSAAKKPTTVPFAQRSGLAFIGGFGHAPNLDAAKWLVSTLMPRVRKEDPTIQCYVVGPNFPSELEQMTSDGIVVTGQVEDLATIFDSIRLTIAPLSYGAGIKGKIIESLAAGIPCVHTSLAAEGMGLPQELDVCRADDPPTIAKAVCTLHADDRLNDRCSLAGLAYVTEQLSEQKLDLSMRQAIGAQQQSDAKTAHATD